MSVRSATCARGLANRIGAVVVGAGLATAGAAPAADADDAMGIYRVVGGKLTQNFKYLASSYSITHANGDCWRFDYHSNGSGSFDLAPVGKAQFDRPRRRPLKKVVKPVFDNGVFKLRGLGWSGTVTRQTAIQAETHQGPGWDDQCPPSNPPDIDTFGCGSDSVHGYVTPPLLPFKGGIPIMDSTWESHYRMGLYGAMPNPLGLFPCPSESTFAALFAGGGVGRSATPGLSDVKLNAFERFHKRIHLGGKFAYSGNQYFAFTGLEDGQGSQNASTHWSLDLKCVARC
jgi:hypothetical protein